MVGAHSLEEMVGKLKRPRRVMILVKAGAAVDAFIDKLVPLLEKVRNSHLKILDNMVDTIQLQGDIIIDGGNSEYQDSQRRTTALSEKGILFVGSGVSGGEEGARCAYFVKFLISPCHAICLSFLILKQPCSWGIIKNEEYSSYFLSATVFSLFKIANVFSV